MPLSSSGSSESGELQEIQNGQVGGSYGPYPVRPLLRNKLSQAYVEHRTPFLLRSSPS